MTEKILLAFLEQPARADYLAAFCDSGYQVDLALTAQMIRTVAATSRFHAAVMVGRSTDCLVSVLTDLTAGRQPLVCVVPAGETDEIALLDAGATLWLPAEASGEVARDWTRKLLDLAACRWPAGFQFDTVARRVQFDNAPVTLRPIEFDLLMYLARQGGRPVDSCELQRQLWPERPPSAQRLAVHIHNLRSALAVVAADALLQKIPGAGYCLSGDRSVIARRRRRSRRYN
jgi:DNA-binding response OmpR family regulator